MFCFVFPTKIGGYFISGLGHGHSPATVANISILHPSSATLVPANAMSQVPPMNLFQPQNLSPNMLKQQQQHPNNNSSNHHHVVVGENNQVMMIRAHNDNVQMLRAQQQQQQQQQQQFPTTNNSNNDAVDSTASVSATATKQHASKSDEISDHIDSVINDVVAGLGTIPSNIHDFEDEGTNSSFKDAQLFNSGPAGDVGAGTVGGGEERGHFFVDSVESLQTNANFNMQQQHQLQIQQQQQLQQQQLIQQHLQQQQQQQLQQLQPPTKASKKKASNKINKQVSWKKSFSFKNKTKMTFISVLLLNRDFKHFII